MDILELEKKYKRITELRSLIRRFKGISKIFTVK